MNFSMNYWHRPFMSELMVTFALVGGVWILRFLAIRLLASENRISPEKRRRIIVGTRDGAAVVIFLGVILIWASELRVLALSMAAFAAAMTIGFKEVFLNMAGAAYRASLPSLSLHQRVTMDDYRGDIIDHDMMGTTIQEVSSAEGFHHYTGRTIVIPNALFLTRPFAVRLTQDGFQFHTVTVPVMADADWERKRDCLVAAVHEVVRPYFPRARESLTLSLVKEGLEIPTLEPSVFVTHPEPARLNLEARFPVPVDMRNRMHQAVIEAYLKRVFRPE